MGFVENWHRFWMSYRKWITALAALVVVGIVIGASLASHDVKEEGTLRILKNKQFT